MCTTAIDKQEHVSIFIYEMAAKLFDLIMEEGCSHSNISVCIVKEPKSFLNILLDVFCRNTVDINMSGDVSELSKIAQTKPVLKSFKFF